MRSFLLLDSSASMGYGRKGVTKLAYASYLAAALAYLLAQQGDPAGLLVFDAETRQYLPPRTRGGHIRDLLMALDARDGLPVHVAQIVAGRVLLVLGELDRRARVRVVVHARERALDDDARPHRHRREARQVAGIEQQARARR